MKTIHKIVIDPRTTIYPLPKNSNIIYAGGQRDDICVWYECDTDEKERIPKTLHVFGTGHKIPELTEGEYKYLGTATLQNDNLILHIYEVV